MHINCVRASGGTGGREQKAASAAWVGGGRGGEERGWGWGWYVGRAGRGKRKEDAGAMGIG